MARFSELRDAQRRPKTELETVARAVLAPSVAVALRRGPLEHTEIEQIVAMCAFNPLFQQVGASKACDLISDLAAAPEPSVTLCDAKATLEPRLRETAICFAIRVAIATGQCEGSRATALRDLASEFGVSSECYDEMFNVLAMLQRSPKVA